MSLLEIRNLTTEFLTPQGTVQAVRDVSYTVEAGEILGIVGESGSGKSVGMLSLMGLLADNGHVTAGSIHFNGQDISPPDRFTRRREYKLYEQRMRALRGNRISMIFQDPMSFLNPVLTVGRQLTEGIVTHTGCTRQEACSRAVELMAQVGIPSPETRLSQYPFEFSGGMRQRIIIAIALSMRPDLIIADEPTTALDVTVQAQILELIREIAGINGTVVILITHDLGVVASMCDNIAIMYGGKIVESGSAEEIFYEAKHPYTSGLLRSIGNRTGGARQTLEPIPGSPPDLLNLPAGCSFLERCPGAMRICRDYMPPTSQFGETHSCQCWLHSREHEMVGAIVRGGAEDV